MAAPLTEDQKQQFIRDGYVVACGLLPPDLVSATRQDLMNALGIRTDSPESWTGKGISADPAVIGLTARCRTEGVEQIAEQLVGQDFISRLCQSPYLEAQHVTPDVIEGYIPVINFPTPGLRQFEKPVGYHIDGMHLTTLWPVKFYLVVFAYLSDVTDYGGATTVLPGSHRQVFEHWLRSDHRGSTHPPDLNYAEPLPLAGSAGDVIFLHYLTVHSGSANHSDTIRIGLNTAVMPDPNRPYRHKTGSPQPDWTPLDYALRTDLMIDVEA